MFAHLYAMTESLNRSISFIDSQLSCWRGGVMWSYFCEPEMILKAKFWISYSFFMLYLDVLDQTDEE